MTDEAENSRGPNWGISETVLIALAAPFSYCVAYAFEWGYASYFKIPIELLSVSLTDTLRAGAALGGVAVLVVATTNGALSLLPARFIQWDAIAPLLWPASIAVLFPYFGGFSYWRLWPLWILVGVPVAISAFPFGKGAHESFFDRLRACHVGSSMYWNTKTLHGLAARRFTWPYVNLAVISLTTIYFVYVLGGYDARVQEVFPVRGPHDELVGLARYADIFVFAERDKTSNRLLPSFDLSSISESNQQFKLEKIGPFLETSLPSNPLPAPRTVKPPQPAEQLNVRRTGSRQ